ncbi:PREDICTED: cilia- and flagella-associated protein 20-like [Nicrophorus vespilloides]|uniref:Cilia- and flagella-associated protein 20-like n=1 Tax=Nicrophorus vespilloides TaxID=110193 RepID=A0ABM1N5M9_NICVS|nr:PREDICTED: cilia- and flagella-associated protein 20-like [Nicrophorus vespilloides]
MFANSFASGFLSIFYSVGSSPLSLWDKSVKNGHIRRIIDDEVKSLVLEVAGTNVATTYITCPIKPRASLGIRLPFLVMVVKNLKKYFTFEIQILDDKDMRRRFRVSNFQSTTKVRPFCTTMPIGLSSGWNQIQFNLADFTRRAYGTVYVETVRVQIHANVRIRRIYFSDRLYSEDELPSEYKLFLPISATRDKVTKARSIIKGQKQTETEEMEIQVAEREIPSGAPPSPVTTAPEEAFKSAEAPEDVETSVAAAAGDVADLTEVEKGEGEVDATIHEEGMDEDMTEAQEGEEHTVATVATADEEATAPSEPTEAAPSEPPTETTEEEAEAAPAEN